MPKGSSGILNARSLSTAHRRLAALLRPGLKVLDVGCGTGAITRGIAEAVGPRGCAVGVDVDVRLVREGQRAHGGIPGLSFVVGNAYRLPVHEAFDIVTSARVLQWLAHPEKALRMLVDATKPGGRVVVLDYNHEKIAWTPPPPKPMQTFYAAFLRWRADAGLDNAIADRLAGVFAGVGLLGVTETAQHEATHRSDPDFETRIGIWAEVAATRGHQMVADGIITEHQRSAAEGEYRAWIRASAESQTLYLVAVEGVRSSDDATVTG